MLSAAERSHPTSEVRSRSWEDLMPEGRRPRDVTPRPRSGAAAESTRLGRRRNGREELPHVRGRGAAERRYPASEVRGSDERSYPASKVRGGGQEEIPHARMPEARGSGQEEQPHARGQGQRPRGATPHLKLGAAARTTNPTSKEQWLRRRRRA